MSPEKEHKPHLPARGRPSLEPPNEPQLSADEWVSTSVTSMAFTPGMPERGFPRSGEERAAIAPALGRSGYSGLSDAEVMLRVKAGDDAAFDYLVEKFRRAMVYFMYRMARNAAVAEELAQEVFLRVYRSRHTYNAEAKFTTWLYRIAGNLAVNHARDTKYERPENTVSIEAQDEETGLSIDIADGRLTVEQAMLRRERMAAIRKHVQSLPERQRLAVVMHKYQNMDYRQIAEVLGISESATKSLLFRAYETLREKLKDFI